MLLLKFKGSTQLVQAMGPKKNTMKTQVTKSDDITCIGTG